MGAPAHEYSEASEPSFDCKDAAVTYAELHSDLDIVRGYAILPGGFTEHWWCVSKRGSVVDVTALAGCNATYIALEERSPTFVSYCDAMVGACEYVPSCEWCKVRRRLERKGHKRVSVAPKHAPRAIVDRLLARNTDLMRELAKVRSERDQYSELYRRAIARQR